MTRKLTHVESKNKIEVKPIERGADIEARSNAGSTPLQVAAEFGMNEVATKLMEKGASIEHQNVDGESALYIAAKTGNKTLTEHMIDQIVERKINKEDITEEIKNTVPTSSSLSECLEYVKCQ